MKQFQRIVTLACILLAIQTRRVSSQLPVIDVADISQNTITAIESTVTAIEEVLIEIQGVLNLTPGNDVVSGGILQDMQLLGHIVAQAQGLSFDIGSIQGQIDGLFNVSAPPTTSSALAVRLQQITQLKYLCYSYAARAQSLLQTALRTIDHLQGLLSSVSSLVGNLAGHQTHTQASTVIAKHVANLDVQIAAFNRAQTVDKLEEPLLWTSWQQIKRNIMSGY